MLQRMLYLGALLIFFCINISEQVSDSRTTAKLKIISFLSEEDQENPQKIAHIYWHNNAIHNSQVDGSIFRKTVQPFQSFMGVTGKRGRNRRTAKNTLTCGFQDTPFARYIAEGSSWHDRNLTYRVTKYPANSSLDRQTIDATMQRAFDLWSRYVDLTFTPTQNDEHINIRFETGDHGDDVNFDGPGHILAHANPPQSGGDVHFDDAEQWSINGQNGIDLFQIAVHEFGHSLGLAHSNNYSAVMYRTYKGYIANLDLHQDDIEGIRRIYGSLGDTRSTTSMSPRRTTSRPREQSSKRPPDGWWLPIPEYPRQRPCCPIDRPWCRGGWPNFPWGRLSSSPFYRRRNC